MDTEVRVGTLRLRPGRAAPPPGWAAAVEDALRVSSKPAALLNRRVWLRRLRLLAPAGAGPQALARLLEREWARVAAAAEPIAQARPQAEAVWAVDEAAARDLLLARWLAAARAGQDESAIGEPWFWHRVAPRAAAKRRPAERLAALLFEPFDDEPRAESRVAAWRARAWASIAAQGLAPAVWAALDEGQRRALAGPRAGEAFAPSAAPPSEPAHSTRAGASVPAVAGFTDRPAERVEREGDAAQSAAADAAMRHDPLVSAEAADHAAAFIAAVEPARSRAAVIGTAPGITPRDTAPRVDTPAPAGFTEPLRSDWAGLALLLPVLLREQGFAAEASAPLWRGLLLEAHRRHRLDAAASAWIAALPVPDIPADPAAVAAWWRRARLAVLRDARLPLRRVLRRRGELWFAPHRLDIVFPLQAADVRLRRAGFDLDPGYLPWLDSVVRFHYL